MILVATTITIAVQLHFYWLLTMKGIKQAIGGRQPLSLQLFIVLFLRGNKSISTCCELGSISQTLAEFKLLLERKKSGLNGRPVAEAKCNLPCSQLQN